MTQVTIIAITDTEGEPPTHNTTNELLVYYHEITQTEESQISLQRHD